MPARLSNWTNLQDVFNANAGQGARMNDAVYGGLENAGQEALDRLQKAKRGFKSAADKAGPGPAPATNYWNQNPVSSTPIVQPMGTPKKPDATTALNAGLAGKPINPEYNYNAATEALRPEYEKQEADRQAKEAAAAAAAAGQAVTAATTASTNTYKGPSTLKEYDPAVGASIADAAARISASPQAQLDAQYGGTTAAGGMLDQALMGHEGGNYRAGNIQSKFGDLLKQLRTEQDAAAKYAKSIGDPMNAAATAAAGTLPDLQQKLTVAQRAAADKETARKNQQARYDYDSQWKKDDQRLRSPRGSQITRTYRPPNSDELPFYPAS